MKKYQTVDEYIQAHESWQPELNTLRNLIRKTELKETIKWGLPVYTIDGKNVVGLAAFNEFMGIWFFQGALLKDPHNRLMNAQEGRTKAMRQWRIQSECEIEENRILEYIREAIENQKKGNEIKPSRHKPLIIPPELKALFDQEPSVEESFEEMSLTKKREFAEFISSAKREETKSERLKKIKPMILEKVGLNDKYR